MKIKTGIEIVSMLFILFFIVGSIIQNKELKEAREKIEILNRNYFTLEKEYNNALNQNSLYIFTIDNLRNSNDSIIMELEKTRKQLKIKDKDIKELGYLLSQANKKDTIFLKDTIFREKVVVDTVITDSTWYKTNIYLEYPNIIQLEQSFISEKELFFYKHTEIIKPSKCWFINLFKKKRDTMEVVVEEKNPYIKNKKQKFIHIIQ